ncbi:MAG: hypothetical protein HKO55_09080 [Gammaproteobacteria bacterium]|nr:hypothetical protein [Gammaproteobacteria bacterium]
MLAPLCALAQGGATGNDISAAYYAADVARLEQLQGSVAADTYLAALLDWRFGSVLSGMGDANAADVVWQRGQAALERQVDKDPGSARSWALLSATLGARIAVKPGPRGMKMGSASGRAGKRAAKLSPEDPFVLMVNGINKYHTPRLFGGGMKRALRFLDAALPRLSTADKHLLPDILVWRAQVLHRLERESACDDLAKALDVTPVFVRAQQLQVEFACSE